MIPVVIPEVGDMVRITREDGGRGVGVVMKTYDSRSNVFVNLLDFERISPRSRQDWKKYGVEEKSGYYTRDTDYVEVIGKPVCLRYVIYEHSHQIYHESSFPLRGEVLRKVYTKTSNEDYYNVYIFEGCPQWNRPWVMVICPFDEKSTCGQLFKLPHHLRHSKDSYSQYIKRCYAYSQMHRFARMAREM